MKYLSYLLDKYVILNDKNIIEIVKDVQKIKGSFNCVCLIENFGLICFKDKYSIRPLIFGKKDNSYIVLSESVSIKSIDYNIISDIYGNDIITCHKNNFNILKTCNDSLEYFKPCIFEWIYLAREESIIYNINVHHSRTKMGEYLGKKLAK